MTTRISQGVTRRELIQRGLQLGGGAMALSVLGAPWHRAKAQEIACHHRTGRFLEIVFDGGWDSALATDPVVGSKQTSAAYQSEYLNLGHQTVPGKDNLVVGPGLVPAIQAFQSLPTAFVNGLLVEVTAHELAFAYLLSGRLSLSRSREYPTAGAVLGAAAGCFPAHVVIGAPVPLGETKQTAPPLHATSYESLRSMLVGPLAGDEPLDAESLGKTQSAIARLNTLHMAKQGRSAKAILTPWTRAEDALDDFYGRGYAEQFVLNEELSARYGLADSWDPLSVLPAALMVLKSGLSPYVTVTIDGFDTHADHLGNHVPLMTGAAAGLASLVADMQNTPDPNDSGKSLAETTTILITSEFVRTPLFNVAAGTDHWPVGAAIVMGRGVADNVVVGATGDDAYALGWSNDRPVERNARTALTPEQMVATVLEMVGLDGDPLMAFGEGRLNGIRA